MITKLYAASVTCFVAGTYLHSGIADALLILGTGLFVYSVCSVIRQMDHGGG